MKSLILKNRLIILILIAMAGIFICLLTLGFSSYAFADECEYSNEKNQAIVDDDTDWEQEAENDRMSSTTGEFGGPVAPEIKGDDANTFYVKNSEYNKIKRTIEGKEFNFVYDLRGFIGEPRGNHRSSYVQYFYNTNSKQIVFLTFGRGVYGFETYTYHGTFDTVFEDSIKYDNFKYNLSNNIEECYLDPKITKIGQYTFQCWKNLRLVDIINQEYDNVHLEIGDCAFRKAGYDNSCGKTKTVTEVRFFKAYDWATQIFLLSSSQRERWAGYCRVAFNGKEYDPVD